MKATIDATGPPSVTQDQLESLERLFHQGIAALKELVDEQFRGRDKQVIEREQRYGERFQAQEKALAAALAAIEKYNLAVVSASAEAIDKAESAQKAVNERQNEFRGQLSDQAATLMPRKESESSALALRDLIDRELKLVRADITDLRLQRSTEEGKEIQGHEGKKDNQFMVTLIVGVITFALGLLINYLIGKK